MSIQRFPALCGRQPQRPEKQRERDAWMGIRRNTDATSSDRPSCPVLPPHHHKHQRQRRRRRCSSPTSPAVTSTRLPRVCRTALSSSSKRSQTTPSRILNADASNDYMPSASQTGRSSTCPPLSSSLLFSSPQSLRRQEKNESTPPSCVPVDGLLNTYSQDQERYRVEWDRRRRHRVWSCIPPTLDPEIDA